MNFLLIFSLLFPTNTASPCMDDPPVIAQIDPAKERDRQMYIKLKLKKEPYINSVNPEYLFSSENSYQPEIAGIYYIKIPKEWRILGLENIIFDHQKYLTAQIQRISDKTVLEIILPINITVNLYINNQSRLRGEATKISKNIKDSIEEYSKKEIQREIELVKYQEKESIREAEAKKQKGGMERKNKILTLQSQIKTNDELEKGCFVIISELKDQEGIVWEIWNCKNNLIAKPTFQSKKFIFQKKQSVIKIKNESPDESDSKKIKEGFLNQIEEIKKASLL